MLSKTRLCVRNLPLTLDEVALRRVFLTALQRDSKGVQLKGRRILQCKIVRDSESGRTVGGQTVARSRGFGFLEFASHDEALKALVSRSSHCPCVSCARLLHH